MDEVPKYEKTRRRRRSAALSTPPAVHVHIGSDGPTSNGSISSRGNTAEILSTSKLNKCCILISMYLSILTCNNAAEII